MFDAFIVTWRESAEALLILALLRACLVSMGRRDQVRAIKSGVALAGVWLSACVVAIVGFAKAPAFDAILTIVAAIAVSLMAMGMAVSAGGIHRRISDYMHQWLEQTRAPHVVALLVSLLLLREGLEMFVLLRAITSLEGLPTMLTGAALGFVAAGLTTMIWPWARMRFGLLAAFRISALVLLLLAARLAMQGCLELLQARWLPIDHDHWLGLASPFLNDGPWTPWVHAVLLSPPLVYFLKTWWREAEPIDFTGDRA